MVVWVKDLFPSPDISDELLQNQSPRLLFRNPDLALVEDSEILEQGPVDVRGKCAKSGVGVLCPRRVKI